MDNMRVFIKKERIYILLLIFIALVSIVNYRAERAFEKAQEKKVEEAGDEMALFQGEEAEQRLKEKLDENPHLKRVFSSAVFLFLFCFFAGIFLSIRLALRRIAGEETIEGRIDTEPARWALWDVCKVGILFILFGYIMSAIEAIIFKFLPSGSLSENLLTALNTTLMDSAAIFFIIYFVVAVYRQKLSALGLSMKNLSKNIFTGITGYITFIPSLVLVLIIVVAVTRLLHYEPPRQPVFDLFLKEDKTWMLVYSTLLVIFIGPVIEETFFRGFLYSALKKRMDVFVAALLSAALFSALHANIVAFFPILLLGLLLAYLYEKTGSLAASITVHIIHNAAMVSLLFFARELAR